MDAAVMFSTETNDDELWSNRIGVQTGQNPADSTEWRWVKSDGSKTELFNILDEPVMVKGVAIQTANVSPTADYGDETAVFTVNLDKVWVTSAM